MNGDPVSLTSFTTVGQLVDIASMRGGVMLTVRINPDDNRADPIDEAIYVDGRRGQECVEVLERGDQIIATGKRQRRHEQVCGVAHFVGVGIRTLFEDAADELPAERHLRAVA